jgi:hypothetical protein
MPARDLEFAFMRPTLKVVLDADLRRAAAVIAELRGFDNHGDEGGGDSGSEEAEPKAASTKEAQTGHYAGADATAASAPSPPPPSRGLFRGLASLVGEAWRESPAPSL